MRQKIQTLISSISLGLTALLLVAVMFAWYATNKVATANGGVGMTANDDYNLDLQRGTYNPTDAKADTNGMVWTDTKAMAFTNIAPGDAFYFRIKIEATSETKTFTTSFNEISSSLSENKIAISNNSICLADSYNTQLYAIDANQKVIVNNKTLYDCTGGSIKLKDYLMHDTFKVYDYGTTEMAPTAGNKIDLASNSALVNFNSSEYTINSTNKYYYFVLEFNEAASLVNNNGISSSNCYLYQKLLIGNIQINEK